MERLSLLARATELGHKISIIAQLKLEDLRRLVAAVSVSPPGVQGAVRRARRRWVCHGRRARRVGLEAARDRSGSVPRGQGRTTPGDGAGSNEQGDARLVQEALEATRAFRSDSLQRVLERGTVRMGHNGVLRRLICPLAHEIGELWQRGEVTAAHEHFVGGDPGFSDADCPAVRGGGGGSPDDRDDTGRAVARTGGGDGGGGGGESGVASGVSRAEPAAR